MQHALLVNSLDVPLNVDMRLWRGAGIRVGSNFMEIDGS